MHTGAAKGRENWHARRKLRTKWQAIAENLNPLWLDLQMKRLFGGRSVSAKVKIARQEPQVVRPNTRRVSRRISETIASVKSSQGGRCRARIRDVSVFGCSLVTDTDWLRSGSFITLQITAEWSIQAIVRWSRDGTGGVEFLRPISEIDAANIAGE